MSTCLSLDNDKDYFLKYRYFSRKNSNFKSFGVVKIAENNKRNAGYKSIGKGIVSGPKSFCFTLIFQALLQIAVALNAPFFCSSHEYKQSPGSRASSLLLFRVKFPAKSTSFL